MKHINSGLLAVSIALGMAHAAFGADMAGAPMGVPMLRAPSAIVASNWDGFYIGGHGGFAWSSSSYALNNGVFSESLAYDPTSFAGGVQSGLQAAWGHWLLGVEGTYTWTGLTETKTTIGAPATFATMDVKYIGTLAARVGWAADRLLIYGKGGWAFGRIHTNDVIAATGANVETVNWDNGYTLGLGAEYQLAPGWVAGLAFDYYKFEPARGLVLGGLPGGISNSDISLYTVTARISYLFNWWR